ncbi:MAG: hypothetical protein KIT22_12325, partial [Verrucomicrobiae bacterium]|nr:hypothetical protein [Verrucomicrobiae bacterium]
QAVESAPARAARIREAVQTTAGQLQRLRSEVQGTVAALKADSESSLAEALVELDAGVGTLARAGYDLTGVDIEQGPAPRVLVHLDQIPVARTASLESLVRETSGQRTLQTILNALIRAEALEEEVQLADLSFQGLIVHLGAVPVVRLCWRRAEAGNAEPPVITAVPTAPPSPLSSMPTGSSLFDKPVTLPPLRIASEAGVGLPPTPVPTLPPSAPLSVQRPAQSASVPADPPASTGDWRKDALAKFKKMPDLSRREH